MADTGYSGRGGSRSPQAQSQVFSVKKMFDDYFSGVKERVASGAADTGRISASKPKTSTTTSPDALERRLVSGNVPKPSDIVNQVRKPSASAAAAGKTKSVYDYLNVNPTPIYDPLMNLINEQKQAANKRYETNSAEIKNIFSALSGVAPADRVRINEQFKNMLTAQQTALANRTAAATAQGNAGAAQAVATGAERGGGEAMALNPLQTATAEGIAGSNQISSIWEGLQGANQAQALADVDTRQEGYNYQQVAAIQGLQQSLEDRLAGIAGTEADVQSQLAKAKFDIASNIGQQKYNNALAAQRAAATGTKAPSGLAGLQAKIGNDAFGQLAGGANDAYSAAWAALNPTDALGKPVSKTVKTPRDSDVKAAWVAAGGNPALLPYLSQYVSSIYG